MRGTEETMVGPTAGRGRSEVIVRPLAAADIAPAGRILYEAFRRVFERHNFPPPFHSEETAIQLLTFFYVRAPYHILAAEMDGRLAGTCVADEHNPVIGIGPISVSPEVQGRNVGRRLMEAMLERYQDRSGVRLLQDAFNLASMSLYASLGFEAKEPIVLLEGTPGGEAPAWAEARPLEAEDLAAANLLCMEVFGLDRSSEIFEAFERRRGLVAVREGRITAYATAVSRAGHGAAETDLDLAALIHAAGRDGQTELAFMAPTRRSELFRWCLKQGLKVVKPMTLMARGSYQDPAGAFFVHSRY
jgi:GNAT superfamily N-acetyltransferase